MELQKLTDFFKWCTIINGGVYVFFLAFCIFAPDFIYQVHSAMFSITRETYDIAIYAFVGLYETLFFIGSIVPFVALLIIKRQNNGDMP